MSGGDDLMHAQDLDICWHFGFHFAQSSNFYCTTHKHSIFRLRDDASIEYPKRIDTRMNQPTADEFSHM